MAFRTAREWSDRGYRICTGAKSRCRTANGIPLFSFRQVTPWEYNPRKYIPSNVPLTITHRGYTYKLV